MRSSGDVKIAVLGGSSAFFPSLGAALAERAADLPALDVSLCGRHEGRTAAVARFCNLLAASRGVAHRYSATTSLREAVEGAAVVSNQVRVGGFAGRSRDEQLALRHGYPGDETIGPSGLAAAIRCLPVLLEQARAVERVAPEAWFLQMSNPMSMLLAGLLPATDLRMFGLCELPDRTLQDALALIDVDPEQVTSEYVGLNHHGFFVEVRAGEVDLLPRIFDRIEADGPGFFAVEAWAMRRRRALPLPYLKLFEHTEAQVAKMQQRTADRGAQLGAVAAELHAHYATTTDPALPGALLARDMPWNAMTVAPVLVALLGGAATTAYVSEPNHGHLPFLPPATIVEKRARITASGPVPEPLSVDVATTHPEITALLQGVSAFEQLGTRAALERDQAVAAAALAMHPFAVQDSAAMVEAMFESAEVLA